MTEEKNNPFKNLISYFQTRELPESLALIFTFLTGILILILIVFFIRYILPHPAVEIKIAGPKETQAGELIIHTVYIKNTGNTVLENPELIVSYSLNFLPEEQGEEVVAKKGPEDFPTGGLFPGQSITFEFKSRLFGAEKEKGNVQAWLNYKIKKGKKSQISKIVETSTQISEIPVQLVLDLPNKVAVVPQTENPFQFRIRFLAFPDAKLNNLKVKLQTPTNFLIQESRPNSIENKPNEWLISSFLEDGKGEIEVKGKLLKDVNLNQELNFECQMSLLLHGREIILKKEKRTTLTSEKIFLISQTVNGKSEYTPYPGERLHFQISFKNLSKEPRSDLVLITVLEGSLFDLDTLQAPKGEFKKGAATISWKKENVFELGYLRPGEEGSVDFWVNLKSDYRPKSPTENNVIIRNRIFLSDFEEIFSYKTNSKVELAQEGYYRDKYRFFQNSGPLPPKVNESTTFTIVWKLYNFYNPVGKIKIKASLPPSVEIRETLTPTQGKIYFSGQGGIIIPLYPGIPSDFKFERSLAPGMSGDDVKYLQIILSKEVPHAFKGPISGYYGSVTTKAVVNFQEKYRNEILNPQGLPQGTGYVDELTKTKLNELLKKAGGATAKEIIWEIEKIEPGTGIFNDPLMAAFQLSLTPTLSQRGKVATIINEATLEGQDQWAGGIISAQDSAIDSTLPDDTSLLSYQKGGIVK